MSLDNQLTVDASGEGGKARGIGRQITSQQHVDVIAKQWKRIGAGGADILTDLQKQIAGLNIGLDTGEVIAVDQAATVDLQPYGPSDVLDTTDGQIAGCAGFRDVDGALAGVDGGQ